MNHCRIRRRQEKQQRREEIVDAAEVVFLREGHVLAKMEDVARQARVSRALVYLYFRNKEELSFAICVRALTRIRERFITAAKRADTGLEQIYEIGQEYVRFAVDSPGYFDALCHLESHSPEIEPGSLKREALDAGKAVHAVTIAVIEQGRRDGSIRSDGGDPLLLSLSLWAVSHGTIQLATTKKTVFADFGVDPAAFTEASLQFALNGLRPAQAPASQPRKHR